MRTTRTAIAAGLLVVEAGLAALGVLVHYGLTAEYGDITDSALEGLLRGLPPAPEHWHSRWSALLAWSPWWCRGVPGCS